MKPMGIVDKKGGPPTDYNSHYQNLVSEIVEDKLSAVETRRNLDAPAGGEVHLAPLSTSGRTEAPGTSQTTQEKAMGPAWSSLLEGVVRDSEAAGGYSMFDIYIICFSGQITHGEPASPSADER